MPGYTFHCYKLVQEFVDAHYFHYAGMVTSTHPCWQVDAFTGQTESSYYFQGFLPSMWSVLPTAVTFRGGRVSSQPGPSSYNMLSGRQDTGFTAPR